VHPTSLAAAKAILGWGGAPELGPLLERHLARERPRKTPRKRPAVSVPDDQWAALDASLEPDDRLAARAIAVIMSTGLRVGDLLRLEYDVLDRAARGAAIELETKGGKPRLLAWAGTPAWARLYDAWTVVRLGRRFTGRDNLAACICSSRNDDPEAGACAYKTMVSMLEHHASRAGVAGRVHLHRLRRTVVTQVLRVTKDIHATARMIGHENIQTTARYADEPSPEQTAELQREIAARFTGGKKP
jgi:integrase/recombinase XerC